MHPVILVGMTQDELKQFVAREVVNYILPNEVLGLGAGSTVEHLIREIAKQQVEIKGVVVCSESARLVAIKEGLEVFTLCGMCAWLLFYMLNKWARLLFLFWLG